MSDKQRRWRDLRILLLAVTVAAVGSGCAWPVTTGEGLVWQNDRLRASWEPGGNTIRLDNLQTHHSLVIPVWPESLVFDGDAVKASPARSISPTVQRTAHGQRWNFAQNGITRPASGLRLSCTVSFEMDHSAGWIRKDGLVTCQGKPALLTEVVIDALDMHGLSPRQPFDGWQSYPVLADGFFTGVEFPAASATVKDEMVRLSCRPGVRLESGDRYAIKPVVYGVCPAGKSREAFEDYIASLRPPSAPIHIQYNSWWSAPFPFTEKHMLDLTSAFRTEFYEPFGGRLDSFCLDMGWANSQSMWQIDTSDFPKGFKPLAEALQKMKSRLALWVSPSSCYPYPGGLDSEWASRQGYETFKPGHIRYACLAGEKYPSAFSKSLVDHTRQYDIAHFKFDGYVPICPESGHGHEPGDLSAEKMAEGFIELCRVLHAAKPDIWLEATCFGYRPSPWWLAHVNTVIGTYGDDAPGGRIPSPIHRESYTTARDFFNLQGTRDVLIPVYAQEVLGIIHQTPEPLFNDAVVTVLRGHSFIPLYVNPQHMNPRRWRFLADLCTWARAHADLLGHTRALHFGGWQDESKCRSWEEELPRDPYGYAHFKDERGLVLLRNSWIRPTQVELTLDDAIGCSPSLKKQPVVCLYPRLGRSVEAYGHGDRLTVELRPYETRLLTWGIHADAPLLDHEPRSLKIAAVSSQVLEEEGRARIRFQVEADTPGRQIWVLAEAMQPFQPPECRIAVNHAPATVRMVDSDAGWKAGKAAPEHWAWFLADVAESSTEIEINVAALDEARISAWLVVGEQIEDTPAVVGPIPPPEERLLDAVEVMAPVTLRWKEPTGALNIAAASQGAVATASSAWSAEHEAGQAIDGNAETRWNSASGDVAGAWLAVDFGQRRGMSSIRFREASGGRITAYKLQRWTGTDWEDLVDARKPASRLTVLHRFEPTETSRIRLLVISATEVPSIWELEAK